MKLNPKKLKQTKPDYNKHLLITKHMHTRLKYTHTYTHTHSLTHCNYNKDNITHIHTYTKWHTHTHTTYVCIFCYTTVNALLVYYHSFPLFFQLRPSIIVRASAVIRLHAHL